MGSACFALVVGTCGPVPARVTVRLVAVAVALAALLELTAFVLAWRNPMLDLVLGHRILLYFVATDITTSLMRLFGDQDAWNAPTAINLITFALAAGSCALEPAPQPARSREGRRGPDEP